MFPWVTNLQEINNYRFHRFQCYLNDTYMFIVICLMIEKIQNIKNCTYAFYKHKTMYSMYIASIRVNIEEIERRLFIDHNIKINQSNAQVIINFTRFILKSSKITDGIVNYFEAKSLFTGF